MPLRDITFQDMGVSIAFLHDHDDAPKQVQKFIDKLVRMIGQSGRLPNSLQPHPVERGSGIFIGYVTVRNDHWRVLFTLRNNAVFFLRLLDHDQMDVYLKNASYKEEFTLEEES